MLNPMETTMRTDPVMIESPCRLSFTLIDLPGASGRKNGMASMMVHDPSFVCSVYPSDRITVESDDVGSEYRDLIVQYIEKLRCELGGGGARVVVDRSIPSHSGFGSKTNTLLSVAKGFAAVYSLDVTTDRLAEFAGRAGTSGGTVNLIDRGGFLVDGGHSTPPGFHDNPSKYLLPSRYAGAGRRPPILIALNTITFESYFKGRQIDLQNDNLKHVVNQARENGIDAIGMSSMGPVCFSFTRTPARAVAWLDELRSRGVVRRHWFTRAANYPARSIRAE